MPCPIAAGVLRPDSELAGLTSMSACVPPEEPLTARPGLMLSTAVSVSCLSMLADVGGSTLQEAGVTLSHGARSEGSSSTSGWECMASCAARVVSSMTPGAGG